MLGSYFNIVRKTLQDTVPKSIMHFMVNKTKQGLQQYLIRSLHREVSTRTRGGSRGRPRTAL